jgi:very-short-patch-repair endonuclease
MGFIIFITIIIVFVIIVAVFSGKRSEAEKKLPYVKKDYFLTKAEIDFFRVLEKALENKHYIFPQVRLSDLLFVKAKKEDYYKYRNKIDRKSVDFVLAEKESLRPLLAIELDDSSHDSRKRKDRDNFVEKALEDTKLPLLRFKVQRFYDTNVIFEEIKNKINS